MPRVIAERYELEREIGRGGMGAVWLARDAVLGRQVAMKRTGIMPGTATADQKRAEREARLAARLSHPHVVAVFDLVNDEDTQWLVMEYVDGVTLSRLVEQEGALPPDRVAALMAQAADGLAAAHEAGIVHRDVKPSNMLIAADDHVKLLDFGIARADSEKTLTATGLVTGSPAYLAPEVASGHGATTASDAWSLGASTYHALAGGPPYEVGDNLMGALYRIVHEDPPRLANAGWLAPMLEGTMTKDVDQRWSLRQVHHFLRAGPGAAAPDQDRGSATQVMAPVPSTPPETPAQPLEPEPTPSRPAAPAPDRSRRGPLLPLLVAATVVLLAVVLGWALLSGGDESPTADPTGDGTSSSEAPSPSESPSESEQTGPTEQGMESFIADYLATAPSSPETAFERLTPAFQRASGGFDSYSGYWNTIESAELVDVTADPEAMTVSYTVDYVRQDGANVSDDVVLRLAYRDGEYLIAEEN